MPRVTILSPTDVYPNPVVLRRDDQTIMWQLAPGLKWGAAVVPIEFLPAGTGSACGSYSDWPTTGTPPRPIPTGVPPNERPYWASANDPMPNDTTRCYHYAILVEALDESGRAKTLRVQVQAADGGWHDPDVENQPQP